MSSPQRVLVTGCSSGFGRLIALSLARAGHRVAAGMRDIGGRSASAARSLEQEAGAGLRVVELELGSEEAASAGVEEALAWLGGLDVVVSNAGVAAAGLVETFSDQALARVFEVNVLGAHRLMRAALPALRPAGRGLLIYVSSTLGRELMPFLAGYCASKFALEAYAEGLAMEVGPLGIETCIVQPGTFPTTAILQNLVPADDGGRAAGYGPMAEAPGQLFAGLGAMAASGQAPDPQLVADVVLGLVDAPRGQRPLRVAVDPAPFDGAARLNAAAEGVQRQKLAGFGLGHLLVLDSARAGAGGP